MTVAELIAKLQAKNPNAQVYVLSADSDGADVIYGDIGVETEDSIYRGSDYEPQNMAPDTVLLTVPEFGDRDWKRVSPDTPYSDLRLDDE